MRTHNATASLAAISAALALSACVQGPEYARPEVTLPQTFRGDTAAQAAAASFAEQPYQAVFSDPALQGLIGEALANNHDLRIAVARIDQARAILGQTASQARPQVNYGAVGGRESTFVPLPGRAAGTLEYSSLAGALNATWELDVWGRIRRATEAAQANLAAQEDLRRGVMLTLVGDVAAGYYRLLELDRELAIAEESSRTYNQTLDLFGQRFKAGRDSRLPVERTQALFDASTSRIADLRRAIAQQENALSVLAGANPRDIARGRPLGEQVMAPTPLGATTALLQRRPDILAAEESMRRANAEIGEALAERFPKIGLSGLVGGVGADIGGGWDNFGTWNIAAGLSGPLYDGGRLKELYNQRKAFWDESVASYRKTVLGAMRETSDALAAQQHLVARRQAQEAQVAALRRSAELALTRYDGGRASYFEVLEAQQQLFPAQDALAQTQRDELIAVVSLYKALGGGWTAEPPPAQAQAPAANTGGAP